MSGKLFPYNEPSQQKELIQKIVSRAYLDFEDECSSQASESLYKDYINYQLHSFLKDKDIEKLLKTAQAVYTELPFYSMDAVSYTHLAESLTGSSQRRYAIMYMTRVST